jgi:putative ABC transport system permease protein
MIGNYVLVALRNLVRHKLYSFINIAGLTVGLTCAIFILLFVRDQLSYDRWIPGTANLYRLEETIRMPGKAPKQSAMMAIPAAQAMLDQIPEVQAMTRLMRQTMTVLVGNRQFPQRVYFADPNLLQMIRLPLVAGDPARVFARPESVVLSQSMARKYFGAGSAIGKTIAISSKKCDATGDTCAVSQQLLAVTGVLKDLPHNTQFDMDVVVPNTSAAAPIGDAMRRNWLAVWCWSYVRLAPGADPDAVMTKFRTIIDQSVDPMKQMNVKARGSEVMQPYLVPFADAHLSTDRFRGMTAPGSWTIVYGFAAIGALILLIACFNFTNLATARAMLRAREISLRKVVGAQRRQLVVQFLAEALLTAMVALVLALALTEALLPLFDRVLGLPIRIDYLHDRQLVFAILGVGMAAGLLSGAYPALILSGFRPAAALRASHGGMAGSGRLRTALVVLQFAVSIGLGIAAVVIFTQIGFARNLDLGFRKDAIVVVNTQNIAGNTVDALVTALRSGGDIADVATTDTVPFDNDHWNIIARAPGAVSSEELALVYASPDYMKLYGIKLLVGRLLSDQRGADAFLYPHGDSQPVNVLVNATAARRLGYSPQDAVGKIITLTPSIAGRAGIAIAGVVADTMQDGSKNPVQGTIYLYQRAYAPLLLVRIRAAHTEDALAFLDRTWHGFAPSTAMQRHFVDDDYDRQFQGDERQGTLFGVFVGVAIFIACLGLFGLAAFSTERRTREIGLRKTFGAGTGDIVWMLLRQFSLPVLIANVIAWPVAWYWLHDWLQGFAYRITLSPLYFLGAGAAAMVIAWATVFVHARRVANANPIHALRYE